jgi:glycosyltransferase involved in cell wall biosynthesis
MRDRSAQVRPGHFDASSRPVRLRIGVVAPAWLPVPPPGYGGIERVVSVLVEGLVASGHDVTLFAAAGSQTSARLVTPLAVAPPLGELLAVTDDLVHTTTAFLRANEFDIIHDHTGMGPALGAMLHPRATVVHTLHGPWTEGSRRLIGLVHDRINLVAISRAQQASNPDLRYAGVVHNGIDLDEYPLNTVKEDFVVFLGRINAEKAPEIAVEVAHRAGLPLVMMVKRTEAAERRYWDEVVAPCLHGDEIVLDQPPPEVKADLLGRARAMLFPINWPEPFGLVMAESMACGTPVIARALGAAPEVISDGVTGFLCSSDDEMVEAVEAARELKPQECRAWAERRFSADAMVAGYEHIYRELLADLVAGEAAVGTKSGQHRGSGTRRHGPPVARAALNGAGTSGISSRPDADPRPLAS